MSKSGKRKNQEVDKHKQQVTTSFFEVGNYVCLHSSKQVSQQVSCRIVRKSRKGYQLYCRKGILNETYPSDGLTSLDNNGSITLDAWHQAYRVFQKCNDSSCMEVCNCVLSKSADNVIELTSSDATSTGITMWVHNAVYSLANDKEIILSLISAAQKVMLQHAPHVWTATTNASACMGF